MPITPEQEQKFKFRARLEAEQSAAQQAPTENPYVAAFTPETPVEPSVMERVGDVAAKINEANLGVVDLPYYALKGAGWLGEKAGLHPEGATSRAMGEPFSERGVLKDFKRAVTSPFVDREKNPKTRAAGTAASWMLGAPVSKLSKASALPDIAMGAGAAAGEYLGDEMGEVSGGIGAALAALLRGKFKLPSNKALEQAEDLTTKMLSDTPDAQAKIAKATEEGVVGTLADLAESPNMYNVEKTLSSDAAHAPLREAIRQAIAKSEADTVKRVSDVIPTASTGPVKLAAQKQLSDAELALDMENIAQTDKLKAGLEAKKATAKSLEGQMGRELSESENLVSALRGKADAAQGKLAGRESPVEASKSLFEKYNILDQNMSVPMKEAYKVIDAAPPINAGKAVSNADAAYDALKLAPTDAASFTKAYKEHLTKIEGWKTSPVEPKEIQAVISEMKQQITDASEGGIKALSRKDSIANGVVKTLEEQLNIPDNVSGFSGFADATKLARAKFDAVSPDTVGKARRANVPETFTDTLSYTGKKGAQTARLAKQSGDTSVVKAHLDTIGAAAKETGLYGGKGVDDAFMKKYSGFLDEFPSEKAEYQKIADANRVSAAAATEGAHTQSALKQAVTKSQAATDKSAGGLDKAIEQLNRITGTAKTQAGKGTVESFGKEPMDTALGLISPKQDVARTKQLTELTEWSKTAGVEDSFKGQVKDALMDRLFPDSGTGLRQATAASSKAFKPAKERLVASGVLTRAEADAVSKALETNAGRQAARAAAGLTEITPTLTPKQKQLAAAAAVTAVTTTGIPHALFAVGFTKRMIEQTMVNMKMSAAGREKMAEFMTNPEKYTEAYEMMKKINAAKGKPSAEKMANVARAVVGAANTTNQDAEE